MQTLKEIDQEEAARRTLAARFGHAKDEDWKAREALKNLEAKLAAPQPDVDALREIVTLASKIPAGLVTQGTRLSPGGMGLAELIRREGEAALGIIARERQALESSLQPAKDRVARAEAKLAEFID